LGVTGVEHCGESGDGGDEMDGDKGDGEEDDDECFCDEKDDVDEDRRSKLSRFHCQSSLVIRNENDPELADVDEAVPGRWRFLEISSLF